MKAEGTEMIRMLKRRRATSPSEQALADTDALVAAGKELEAIQRLTEANRKHRDRRIERRLVELRFEAFKRIHWSDSPPAKAPVVEDLFPGQLIPEIAHADLTAERLESAIQHHGSLLVRGLVGRERVDRLVNSIDSSFDAFDAKARGERPAEDADWYTPIEMHGLNDAARADKRRGGGMWAVDAPPALFDLIEILSDEGLGDLAREYFAEPPMLLARKVTLRRMAHDASGGWHQDGAFMGLDLRALNVWLALTPCGIDAPSLDVVGRRVDYIVTPGGGSKAYAVSAEEAEAVSAGTIVRPIFEPGDALIFDHLCLHRTGRDKGMTKGRYAIETWLMAPSTYAAMITPVENGYQPFDQQPLVF